jgi:hypothetical protein
MGLNAGMLNSWPSVSEPECISCRTDHELPNIVQHSLNGGCNRLDGYFLNERGKRSQRRFDWVVFIVPIRYTWI